MSVYETLVERAERKGETVIVVLDDESGLEAHIEPLYEGRNVVGFACALENVVSTASSRADALELAINERLDRQLTGMIDLEERLAPYTVK